MQKVVGQNPHLQPGLVGLEPLTASLVPAQGVLPFLDPVFYLGPAVIDLYPLEQSPFFIYTNSMSPTPETNPQTFNFRNVHPQIFIGTASDRYAGWIGQIYSKGRYDGLITVFSKICS